MFIQREEYWQWPGRGERERADAIEYEINNPNSRAAKFFLNTLDALVETCLETIRGERRYYVLPKMNLLLLSDILVTASGSMQGERKRFCRRLTELLWLVERGSNKGPQQQNTRGFKTDGEVVELLGRDDDCLGGIIRAGFTPGWELRTGSLRTKLGEFIENRQLTALTISWGRSGKAIDWDQGQEWIPGVNVEHDPQDRDMRSLELPINDEDEDVRNAMVDEELRSESGEEEDEEGGTEDEMME